MKRRWYLRPGYLFFLLACLVIVVWATTANFGYETIGTTDSSDCNGRWWGYRFTGVAGTASSITAHLHTTSGTGNFVYAIYLVSSNAKVAQTNVGNGDGTTGWFTLTFASPPTLTAVDYYLVAWANAVTYMDYDGGTTDYCITDTSGAYPTFPASVAGASTSNKKFSIYCTVTLDAASMINNIAIIIWPPGNKGR